MYMKSNDGSLTGIFSSVDASNYGIKCCLPELMLSTLIFSSLKYHIAPNCYKLGIIIL